MKRPGILLSVTVLLLFFDLLAAYTLDIDNIHKGEYNYQYDTDAITEDREGKIDENGDQVVKGTYTFFLDDTEYTVTYYADKSGYHPTVTISKVDVGYRVSTQEAAYDSRAVATILG